MANEICPLGQGDNLGCVEGPAGVWGVSCLEATTVNSGCPIRAKVILRPISLESEFLREDRIVIFF